MQKRQTPLNYRILAFILILYYGDGGGVEPYFSNNGITLVFKQLFWTFLNLLTSILASK